jgi:hypothetical protein
LLCGEDVENFVGMSKAIRKIIEMAHMVSHTGAIVLYQFQCTGKELIACPIHDLSQLGYSNNYVLQGGLNYWAETILNPEAPPSSSPNEEILKYNLRKGAGMALGGQATENSAPVATPAGPVPPVQKRETKKRVQGGY